MQFQWLTCLSVVLFHNVALSMNVSPKHLDLRQATPTTAQAKSSSIVDTHTQVSTRSVSASASTSVSSSSTATPSVTVTTGPSCTQTVNPDKNGHVPPGTCHAYFEYYPSFEAAFLFSILFGITTIIHIGQAIHYRKAFCWVITMGAAWELVAFITRTLLTRHQQNTWLALTSNLLILLAPLWINAFAYMVLARMIYFFVPERALFGIRASTFALIFVSLDIFSFLIQFIGGAMASPTAPPDQQLRGFHVYMAGISFQELLILMFLCLVIKFHVEWCKLERAKTGPYRASRRAWWLLYGLYIILGLITVRSSSCLLSHIALTRSTDPHRLSAGRILYWQRPKQSDPISRGISLRLRRRSYAVRDPDDQHHSSGHSSLRSRFGVADDPIRQPVQILRTR